MIAKLIKENGSFPNHPLFPTLLYKKVLVKHEPDLIRELFLKNQWKKIWINGIYAFHHYHSNTHEALGVCSGCCEMQLGGDGGIIFQLEAGDVLILPAGVSHKSIKSTDDFVVVGAYPFAIDYNMSYGKLNERPEADLMIKKVPLPDTDPVFGINGPLFNYWQIEKI